MNLTLEDQDDPKSPILPEAHRARDEQVPQQTSTAPTATLSPVATATLASGVPQTTQNQDATQTTQVFSPPPPQDLPPPPSISSATTSQATQPVSSTSNLGAPASVTPTPNTNANTNTNTNGSSNTTSNISANGASVPATADTTTYASSAPANTASSANTANTLPGILEPQLDQAVDIRTRCRALWDWNADPADDEQISFKAGDILVLIRREDEWYYGENLKNHEIGYFPGNYVEVQARNWKVDANRVTPKIVSLQQSLMPVSN